MDPLLAMGAERFWMTLGLLVLLVPFVLLAARGTERRREARSEGRRRYGSARGLAYHGERSSLLDAACALEGPQRLRTLAEGDRLLTCDALEDANGSLAIVDCELRTGHRSRPRAAYRTVAILRVPRARLPYFFARPQNTVLDALGKLVGGEDLDFAEDAEFSRAYVLQSRGEAEAVRSLFGDALRGTLRRRAGTGLHLEGVGELVVAHRGRRLEDAELDDLVAAAREACGLR